MPTLQTLSTLSRQVSIDKEGEDLDKLSIDSTIKPDLKEDDTPLQEVSKLSKVSGNYQYNCYECRRANHGTPKYQTDSLVDYRKHWISSGHTGPCQPSLVDIQYHGWEPQGKEWET